MYRWTFDINRPTGNYMRELSQMPDTDIWISEQSNDLSHWFLFSSVHLNQIDKPTDVYERAFKFKLLIDGISYLIHENKNAYGQIVLGTLYDENNSVVNFNRDINNYKFDFTFQSDVSSEDYKRNQLSHLIHIASTDSYILNILLICSQGMDFNSLYQALDETKTFLKGKAKLDTLGVDAVQLNRFTHTANNFEALGIESRHGSLGHEPPKNPISLQEAQSLITHILSLVIERFYGITLPLIKEVRINADDLF
jgi:hypothetical protein